MSENLQASKTRVAALSVASNSLLVGGKLLIGLMIGSVSVISEAIHSGMDLLAAVIALFAVRGSALRLLQMPVDMPHMVPR